MLLFEMNSQNADFRLITQYNYSRRPNFIFQCFPNDQTIKTVLTYRRYAPPWVRCRGWCKHQESWDRVRRPSRSDEWLARSRPARWIRSPGCSRPRRSLAVSRLPSDSMPGLGVSARKKRDGQSKIVRISQRSPQRSFHRHCILCISSIDR